MLAGLAAAAWGTEPLPPGQSQASIGWWRGFRGDDRSVQLGPLPQGIVLPLTIGGTSFYRDWGTSTWQVQGLASTSVGTQAGPGPAVGVSTRADGVNVEGVGKADAGVSATSHFRIAEDATGPAALTAYPAVQITWKLHGAEVSGVPWDDCHAARREGACRYRRIRRQRPAR